jgi:hypothetical protein
MEGGITASDAATKLAEWFSSNGGPPVVKPEIRQTPAVVQEEPERNIPLAEKFRNSGNGGWDGSLKGIDAAHPYLASRGFEPAVPAHFGVGYYPGKGSMANRVVFPIHDFAGKLVAYAGRLVGEPTEDNPRWKFPKSFQKHLELFNPAPRRGSARLHLRVVLGPARALPGGHPERRRAHGT